MDVFDYFTRADNTDISVAAPAKYTAMSTGTAQIISNRCQDTDTTDADCAFVLALPLPGPNHYAEARVGTFTTSSAVDVTFGVYCRLDGSATRTGYMCLPVVAAGPVWNLKIFKWVAGTPTALATSAAISTPVANDVVRMVVQGNTILGFYNNIQLLAVSDTSVLTGNYCGFQMARANGSVDSRLSQFSYGGLARPTLTLIKPPSAIGYLFPGAPKVRQPTIPVSVSAIKTVDGLAKASVKTVDGLPIASVKTIDGLA